MNMAPMSVNAHGQGCERARARLWCAMSAPPGADGAQTGSCIDEEKDENHRSAAACLIQACHQSINQSMGLSIPTERDPQRETVS